mmetsp:Transcript_5057/g.7704  ORF Transcript_5057/g.7704 Transcript_5057/m.7704 type:complete len:233 (+) Transcript_5057:180-878(+)
MSGGGTLRSRPVAGTTLSALNIDATRQQFELDALLHPELRNNPVPVGGKDDGEDFEQVERKLAEFSRVVDQLEQMSANDRDPSQRAIWGKRCQGYRQRYVEFQSTFSTRKMRQTRRSYESDQRSALFGQRQGGDDVLDVINNYGEESDSLQRSTNIAADTISQGISVLENLKDQGSTLKRARDTLKEIANVLGLSNSLLRVIDRREWGDRMLVYGGMVFTVVFLYLVYYFSR